MADNTVSLWASDDVGGIQHARVKLEFGPDGTANYVSYTKPLPANVAIRGDALMIGSVSAAPATAIISCSSSATATIVAAQTSSRIMVLDYVLVARATTSVYFGSGTFPLTGTMTLDKSSGTQSGFNAFGHLLTNTNHALTITAGDGAVAGHLVYIRSQILPIIRLDGDIVSDATAGGSTSQWRISSDGGVYWSRTGTSGGAFIKQYDWIIPNSAASQYECTWTADTGTVDTTPGAAGTWLACTSDRTWAETNAGGAEQATFVARIRKVGETVENSSTITLEVDGSSA